MVHHQRLYFHQPKKGSQEKQQESMSPHHRHLINFNSKLTLLRLFFLFSLICFTLVFAPRLLFFSPSSLFEADVDEQLQIPTKAASPISCSSLPNNTICCDRTSLRSDVCFMRGDVRTHSESSSIILHQPTNNSTNSPSTEEKIRPYTRKWESSVMSTIDELRLRTDTAAAAAHSCDVHHSVPAVVFSTGGYTGNVYHDFNDGLIPLYITAEHFNKQVAVVLLEYHSWWFTKYGDVLSRLSDYPPIDFANDPRTHCFPEAIIGLRIHGELTVDPSKMINNRTITDFRQVLDESYKPRIREIAKHSPPRENPATTQKPKLVILSRNGSRAIENEGDVVRLGEEVGFRVEVLRPERTSELARIYGVLNSSDAMVGVHGAAMAHQLFMRPGAVVIQVVPLGTEWAAGEYYGGPAVRMGLEYVRYKVRPRESSLYREYGRGHAVIRDPESVNAKGWEVTKRVYLDGQSVRLDLGRFRKRLVRAHRYLMLKRRGGKKDWKQEKN